MTRNIPDQALEALCLDRLILPNGIVLHHVAGGSGVPLVFVHGVLGDWRSWAPQWEAFTAHFRCHTYSRRYSTPNGNKLTRNSHSAWVEAEDLRDLLDALGLRRVVLVGSSYGGLIALALACVHPDRVIAIVTTEPPVLGFGEFSPAGQAAVAAFRRDVHAPALAAFRRGDDALGVVLMTAGIHGADSAALQGAVLQRRLENARAMRVHMLCDDEFPTLPREQLADLSVPVLLVTGELSGAVHAESFRGLCAVMPQARVLTIAAGGHAITHQCPEAFNAATLDFLSSQPARRSVECRLVGS